MNQVLHCGQRRVTPNKILGGDVKAFNVIGYILIVVVTFICVAPFILIVSGSLSSAEDIAKNGFSLFIRGFSLEAYKLVFQMPDKILRAYKVTIIVTVTGTLLHLWITSMAAYVLSRRDFRYRNRISFYLFFTTIFGGGLVPYYIMVTQYFHFKDHPYMAMILPGLVSYFNIIIIRGYMSSLPNELTDSAKIDGANDFVIYAKIIMPLSKSALATVALFTALSYWNDWYGPMLYVKDSRYYNLQYYLYNILNSAKAAQQAMSEAVSTTYKVPPTETYKLAMTVVTVGPIVLVYPFLQKYFITGITIGAVKG